MAVESLSIFEFHKHRMALRGIEKAKRKLGYK
jgi:hypothetical protein